MVPKLVRRSLRRTTIAEITQQSGLYAIILSNGTFLADPILRAKILSFGFPIQITSDPRYYPKTIEPYEHPLISYEHHIRTITPLGRAKTNKIPPSRTSPLCFNLRSAVRTLGLLQQAIHILRSSGKMCTPSINIDGTIVAGESPFCHKIGTVDTPDSEIVQELLNMNCNNCGLEDNLPTELKEILHPVR
jgi:hypothetical protein